MNVVSLILRSGLHPAEVGCVVLVTSAGVSRLVDAVIKREGLNDDDNDSHPEVERLQVKRLQHVIFPYSYQINRFFNS